MATPRYETTCIEKKLIATDVYQLRFIKPEGFAYSAGQFVLFDTPHVDDLSTTEPRAYSIASMQDEEDLLFVIKLKDGGRFSEFLRQKLDVGTEMTFVGPLGFFTPTLNDHAKMLIGTGTGIAPLRAHLRFFAQHEYSHVVHVLFGVRESTDLFWVDELKALGSTLPSFSLHLCLSAKHINNDHYHGRVSALLPSLITDALTTDVSLCGNPAMVKELKTQCIDALQIPKKQVHGEGYV